MAKASKLQLLKKNANKIPLTIFRHFQLIFINSDGVENGGEEIGFLYLMLGDNISSENPQGEFNWHSKNVSI